MGEKRTATEGGSLDIYSYVQAVSFDQNCSHHVHVSQTFTTSRNDDLKTEVKGNNFPKHSAQKM